MQSAPVCDAEVTLEDSDSETITLQGSDVSVTQTGISFTNENLATSHRYKLRVTAYNINGSATSDNNYHISKQGGHCKATLILNISL